MAVEAIFYQEEDGTCPVIEFFSTRPAQAQARARAHIEVLKEFGHTLRRPYAENLGHGLYELRMRLGRVQYRILYFFHGQTAVVLAHALTKEAQIPQADLTRALHRKALFETNPEKYTFRGPTL